MSICLLKGKFKNSKGWLTRYALACGYIERFEIGYQAELYASVVLQDVGGTLCVTLWRRHGKSEHLYPETLAEARKQFRRWRTLLLLTT